MGCCQGFEVNLGGNHQGSPTSPGGKGYYSPYNNSRLENGPEGEYLTDRLTDESLRFIQEHQDSPFFLYLSYYSVHTPIQGARRFDAEYQAKQQTLPGNGAVQWEAEGLGRTQTNQCNPAYAAMVRSVDYNVGRILDTLETLGLLENTLIVFTSDNGGLSTRKEPGPTSVRPLRAGKGWCFEGGIRIPTLIYAPGLSGMGRESSFPLISMDFYPTLLELAGLPSFPDQYVDGQSVLPWLEDPLKSWDRTLVWHYPHYHGSTWRPGSAIRSGPYKLVYTYEDQRARLYNLETDMGERQDLSSTHPGLTQTLYAEMIQYIEARNGAFPHFP